MDIFIFWISIGIIFYTWCLYPLLLAIFSKILSKKIHFLKPLNKWPFISIILPVHNEELAIKRKLDNLLSIDYPNYEIIVVSDGSTDNTEKVVLEYQRSFRNVKLLSLFHVGKSTAQNEGVKIAKGDIIVFTDVDSIFEKNVLKNIVLLFQNPQVGCVTAQVKWINPKESAITEGGNIYWKYENFLWRCEDKLGLLAWGAGTCLAVRRSIFRPIPPYYGEDCIVPLDIVEQGFLVKYQPKAVVYDFWSPDIKSEFKARVRMTLRSCAGTLSKKRLLNPLKFPKQAWAIWSHKLLRWLTPYWAFVAFITNLFAIKTSLFYLFFFIVQCLGYFIGLIGIYFTSKGRSLLIISHIGSFLLVLCSFAIGIWQALRGQKIIAYRSNEK